MTILVLNCGSSSIKYQIIKMHNPQKYEVLVKGIVERIGLEEGMLSHKPTDKSKFELAAPIPDHTAGIKMILDALVDPEHGVLKSISEIDAVGHRVAHGGEYFKDSALITETVKKQIDECSELAPLHNPANLKGIIAMEKVLPHVPQVAVFDTSFHQTVPAKNFMYGLPYKYYEKYRIRSYGFHGTSHKYVAQKACDITGLDINNSKIITCHLGGGASITAILNGKSYATSMGFTPVDGLIMGTRCGSVDPGALTYMVEKENLSMKELGNIINKDSGVWGISGVSSDMRDINKAMAEGNQKAILAMDMYTARIRRFIGGYAALMGGVDMVVFTGGVGENDYVVRELVCRDLEFMGIKFDTQINNGLRGEDKVLSLPESKVKVVTVATNEELVIANDTFRLTEKK